MNQVVHVKQLSRSNCWSAREELSNEINGKFQEVFFQKNRYHVAKETGSWRDYQFEAGWYQTIR